MYAKNVNSNFLFSVSNFDQFTYHTPKQMINEENLLNFQEMVRIAFA